MESIQASIRIRPINGAKPEDIAVREQGTREVIAIKHSDKFEFERVFGQEKTNNIIFEESIKGLLQKALSGYNGRYIVN